MHCSSFPLGWKWLLVSGSFCFSWVEFLTRFVDEGMRVEGGDSNEERRRALICAREFGLDVNPAAVVVVKRSADKAFEVSCS